MATQQALVPATPKRTRQRVVETLREMILEGWVPAGARLMQQDLADRLGASVNLVREVLFELRNLGMLEMQPGVGFSVPRLDVDRFMDTAQVHAVLDGLSARLCCRRACREDLDELRDIARRMHEKCLTRDSDDLRAAHGLDRQLHGRLFQIAGSPSLLRAEQVCWIPSIAVENCSEEYMARYSEAYEEHLAILAAIEEDRPDDAEELARRHRRTGMRRVKEEAERGNVVLRWY